MDIILQSVRGHVFQQRQSDAYINATALCKRYKEVTGKRREVSEWLSNKRTQEDIKHLESITGIPVTELVQVIQGGSPMCQGTYLHPKLSVRFGIWLSSEFGYLVEECFEKWSSRGILQSAPSQIISASVQAIADYDSNWDCAVRKIREIEEIERLIDC